MNNKSILYISMTLDHFFEPVDPILRRVVLAPKVLQDGVNFERASPALLARMDRLISHAKAKAALPEEALTKWKQLLALAKEAGVMGQP